MFWKRRRAAPREVARDTLAGIPPELLARVRAIEIRARRLVNDLFLGEYRTVFRGRGIEFDELRPYIPGDDVRSIDWKAYARTAQPLIRRYREEREQTVIFAVDVSASQQAGALPMTKADTAAEIAAVLALAAIRNKDRVGLLLFASKPELYLRPSTGSTHVLRVVREMLWSHPATHGTDIGGALEYLMGILRRRATVFLFSDFLTERYERQLAAAARRHDIIAIRVREPLDEALPNAGLVAVRDAETGELREVDTSSARVRETYSAAVERIDTERRRVFGEVGIDEIPVLVGTDYVPALLKFFKRRTLVTAL